MYGTNKGSEKRRAGVREAGRIHRNLERKPDEREKDRKREGESEKEKESSMGCETMRRCKLKGGKRKKKRESEFLTLFRVFRAKFFFALHTVQQTKVKHAENKFKKKPNEQQNDEEKLLPEQEKNTNKKRPNNGIKIAFVCSSTFWYSFIRIAILFKLIVCAFQRFLLSFSLFVVVCF